MATETEIQILRTVYEQVGDQSLVAAKARIEALNDEFQQHKMALYGCGLAESEYQERVRKTAAELVKAERALAGLNAVAAPATAATDAAAKSTLNLGQAGLTAGRALQDFSQGGIGGILNNIEGMASALGGGPGLAGILTAVGVAAFIAKPYIMDFIQGLFPDKIDAAKTAIEHLTDSIGKLKDKAGKDVFERVQLAAFESDLKRATAALKAFQDQRDSKTKAVEESEAAVKSALKGSGAEAALKKEIGARLEANDPVIAGLRRQIEENEARAGRAEGRGHGDAAESIRRKNDALRTDVQARQNAIHDEGGAAQEAAGHLLNGDPDRLANALRKVGRVDDAKKVEAATPAALESKREYEAAVERASRADASAVDEAKEDHKKKIKEDADGAKVANDEEEANLKEVREKMADERKADDAAAKGQELAGKMQADDAAARDKGLERTGKHAAGQYGAPMQDEIEQRMLAGQNRIQIGVEIQKALKAARATDENGQELDTKGRAAAAGEMMNRAKEDISRRTLNLGNVVSDVQANQLAMAGKLDQVDQMILQLRRQNQAVRGRANNALRRGQ